MIYPLSHPIQTLRMCRLAAIVDQRPSGRIAISRENECTALAAFRAGLDTKTIADEAGLHEALVAGMINRARQSDRRAA